MGNSDDSDLYTFLIHVVRARGPTPSVIESPRLNAGQDIEAMASAFEDFPSRKDQKGLKMACLVRDGGKCVVTGFHDSKEYQKLSAIEEARSAGRVQTQAAHIIPFSIENSIVSSFGSRRKISFTNDLLGQ